MGTRKDHLTTAQHAAQLASARVTVTARRMPHTVRFATPKRLVTNKCEGEQ